MPSPQAITPWSSTPASSEPLVAALLSGSKFGGSVGTGAKLTFSFPDWSASPAPVYVLADGTQTTVAGAASLSPAQQAAATDALAQWAHVANIAFTQVADTSTNVGDIRFTFTSVAAGDGIAYASSPAWYPIAGDVFFSTSSGSPYRAPAWAPGSDAFETVLHELGHALGLKHPFDGSATLPDPLNNVGYTVMAYSGAPKSWSLVQTGSAYGYQLVEPDGPMVGDIAAMQYLYGANTSYHAGDDTYTFDPTTPFFHTIWDAGGTNTISLANFTKACSLDLRPGHYTNLGMDVVVPPSWWTSVPAGGLYDGTGALAIAYGCTIQNAIGGSGNDTIIGNDADNTITGGPGNDAIDGGAGFNTACYAGKQSNFTFTHSASALVVSDKSGAEGTDTLTNIEQLKFADGGMVLSAPATGPTSTVAKVVMTAFGAAGLSNPAYAGAAYQLLAGGMSQTQLLKLAGLTATSTVDLSAIASTGMDYGTVSQQHAEQAYRLYQAAFNRTPDFGGVAFWTQSLEKGTSLDTVAQGFLQSPEFQATYGSLDTLHYVDQLYQNVLHRLPDPGGETFWTNNLSAGALTRAQTLAQFSESAENVANLVGVLEHGALG